VLFLPYTVPYASPVLNQLKQFFSETESVKNMNLPAIVPGVGTENEVEAESVETVATTSNN